MPTVSIISIARALICSALQSLPSWRAMTSSICSPTLKTGLSEVMGSW